MTDLERAALLEELRLLKAGGARRQDLSQHACKRLFFDFGIRPSMATVRDLTQTGSASDIPRDIDAFWVRIRTASKIRIEGGALPEALQERAGELLGQLFSEAQQFALAALESDREAHKDGVSHAISELRDAEVRYETIKQALERSEAKADAAAAGRATLETELAVLRGQLERTGDDARSLTQRMESERHALTQRLEAEQTANATLRERIDELNVELRQSTTHYAQQIKDAVSEAERRVKPMLVELDALRGMATTYQSGVREASQKEFEYIQQLSSAKARADRAELQLRQQSDQLDAIAKDRDLLAQHRGVSEAIGRLIAAMVMNGRLSIDEIERLGTEIDSFVSLPGQCPACEEGEPELSVHEDEFELACPDCNRTSGAAASRIMCAWRFSALSASAVAPQNEG